VRVRQSAAPVRTARTDDDGAFRVGGLADGTLTLEVDTSRTAFIEPAPREVALGDGQVDVVLRRGAVIEGTVVDGAGRPVTLVLVRALRGEDVVDTTFVADGTGAFRLQRLPPGRYTLRVFRPSRAEPLTELSDVETGAAAVTLRVPQ
jgi:hypothetical protein